MEIIRLKDLPALEKPREKAIHFGIDKLSNNELLALIIGSGNRNADVMTIANNILIKAGGIHAVLNLSFQELRSIYGVNDVIALRLLAMTELWKRKGINADKTKRFDLHEIATRYSSLLGYNQKESMYLIGINREHQIIFERELYIGSKSSIVSAEDEIIDFLKKSNALYFVIVHNHPSGNPLPSKEDVFSTNHLKIRASHNNLRLLDHIIVARNEKYYSFFDHNIFV